MRYTCSKVAPVLALFALLFVCGQAHAQSPTITSISPTSGAVGVPVMISGSNFGATQGSSTVSLNGTTAAVASWNATTIVAIVPSGATSGTFQVTVSGQPANSTSFTVTPLPFGWSDGDVGSVGVAGSAGYAGGTFTVAGAGSEIGASADVMNFAYQTMSGDGTIVARVVSTQGSGAQAGVMIRETLNPGATMAQTFYYSSSIYFQFRSTTGGGASVQDSYLTIAAPYWVKVARSGSTFNGYISPDGVNWVQVGSSETITMAQSVYVGLTVSSQSTTATATATFDNVSINSAAAPGPVITGVSATTGSVGSQVVISGTGFGSSQGNSLVTLHAAPMTVNSWDDTLITITIPSGASSGLLVASVAPSMNDSNPVVFTVTAQPLPSTWLDQDVGQTGLAGSSSYANGVFTVTGGGLGITGTADAMHFVYQPLSDNGTMVARVVTTSGSNIQAGVMIRETLNPGATMAFSAWTPSASYIYFASRTTTGGSDDATSSNTEHLPYWIEVVRSGNTFSGYMSPDGVNWVQMGSGVTISMAENAYIGLAVSSESTTALATATFDNVSVTTTAAPGPVITGVSATTGSIGSQVVISGSGFGSLQGNSVVILNGLSMMVNSWSDTTISITISAGATSGLLGVSVAPSMDDSNPVVFTVTSQPLPTSWLDQDVGTLGAAGSSSYANGVFTVKGAGELGGTADTMHFVYQPLSGNGTIVARVLSLQGTNAEAGVMIRQSLSPSDMMADADANLSSSDVFFRYRATVGATAQSSYSAAKVPYWVELVRSGNTFSGFMSSDGVNWVQVGTTETINMTQNAYIGLAVATASATTLGTATFDNVSINSTSVPAPVITSLSATTGPVGSQIQINGSGFGFSQGSGQVMLNDVPMTVNSWTNLSIDITIAAGATSGPMVVSVPPAMNNSNPMVFTVTTQPLPSTWLDQDVGSVGLAGSSSYVNGVFTVQGAGAGTFSTADGMHFVYQPLSGNGMIIARVLSLTGSGPQAGVMIRETLSPGATMASTTYRLGYGYFVDRPTTGATTSSASINPVALPYWVEVVRSGNSFSGYMSLDGVNWQQVGTTETITMAQNVYVGLAVSSESTASLATATFDNVSINSAATPAPIITSVSATSGPVGSQVAIFGSGFGATQGSSLVTVNDVPASINSWGATAITISIPSGATSGPLVVSLGPSMNSSNPVPFTVTSNPIPSGWLDQDIGEVGQAGSASFASGVFTVQGAGTLFGTADSFHFVYQPLSGNGTIIARVATLSGSSSPKAGVIIRETLGSSATFAATLYTASYGYFYWRTTTGSSSTYNDRSAGALPYWVEVVRNGSTFNSYISPDGVNWSQVAASQTISMAQNVYVGLVVSDSPSVLATATFDNVSVNSSTTLPTPVITAISPNAALPFSAVTITGNNFQSPQGSSTISFNGTTANATAWSSTSISTSVPSGATTGNIVVTVNGLPSNGINFAVLARPTISTISPGFAGRGAQVTINGTNFGATPGNSTVTFNGSPAITYVSWSPTQIVAVVPNNATTGPVIVTVTSLSSVTTNPSLTVVNPVLSSISPTAAGPRGYITLNGSGFGYYDPAVVVTFNGVIGGSFLINDSLVTAIVPANATTGPLIVTVEGVASNSLPFTMVEALSITGISPTVGPPGGSVTITGAGFGPSQSNSVVAFYGTTATVSSWSDTQIVAIVPADALPGPVSVEVAEITINGPNFTVNSTIQLTDSLGNQSNYTSALAGGMWHVTQSQGSGCSSCSDRGNIQSQYDSSGNLILKTDELGHTTSYTYDSNKDMTSMSQQTSAGGTARTSYTYNSFGEVLTMTDALGNVTTNTYDSYGNLLTVTTPAPNSSTAGSLTQFAYNSLGELTQITDPLGRITKLTYTSAGLIYTITDPQQNVTTYQYDSRGNRTSITDAMNNTTTFAYDSGNRLLTITYPGGTTTTSFTYDYRGRRITMTDQNGKTTAYAYDDADRLTSVTDPNNNVTQYGYDTENNLLSIEDANSHTTSFTYDAFGRVTETSFPSTHYEQYAYDAANNLISKTDRKGQTINYVYDDMYRLTQKTYPDSTSVEYVYDLVGKIRQVTDPSGTYGFAYDNMGRLVGTTTQYTFLPLDNFTNSYSYDANSNRLTLTDPQGGVTSYAYDTLNRLSTLTPPTAFSSTGFGFTYDALSRRTQMTRPNGVTTNYSYDNLSRLLSVLHQVSASTIDGAAYTYDSAGNRTAKTNELSAVTSNYTYDPLYELTQVTQATNTTESYSYDPVGNRLSSLGVSSYTNNSSNEVTSTSAASYAFDANGNLTSKTVSGSTTQYAWDYENRLTSAVLPGAGGTVAFKYDPAGRRIQKVFTQGSTSTTTNYLYDGKGANLTEEVNSSGNAIARYLYGKRIDEPLAELSSGVTSYYETDGMGSVSSLTATNGSIAQSYTYDSFGDVTASTGSLTNPFQYTGREFDSETSLYFYRARYYDQTIGRFISEDPLAFGAGDVNFYTYVGGNPTNYRDPSGQTPIPWIFWGNWCGPNWTGHRIEEYNPKHAKLYRAPIDPTDAVCKDHDICYYNCRVSVPCDAEARSKCMRNCDGALIGNMPSTGIGPILAAGVDFFNSHPDAGPNAPNCPGCKEPPAPPRSCAGFSCLDNR